MNSRLGKKGFTTSEKKKIAYLDRDVHIRHEQDGMTKQLGVLTLL